MASCICVFQQEGNSGVSGSIKISQASESGPSTLEGQVRGLTPGQKHGISVCTYGDLSDGSTSCGGPFNPFDLSNNFYPSIQAGKTHGAPTDDPSLRMVGDIGNIEADESGVATVEIEDSMVKLFGPQSVIGRSLVIFAGADDRGRGGQEKSLTTGNPGPRIACGVIGLSS
eukprot:scaffold925_cov129-Cylindrotheca_fusiformis.AAC.18